MKKNVKTDVKRKYTYFDYKIVTMLALLILAT